MTMLRLLADDLTGALDSAAAFGTVAEPVAVRWCGEIPPEGAVAIDSRTREVSTAEACSSVRAIVPSLWARPAGLAYKKIDSLLRGQEVAEIAAILDLLRPGHCIIVPAFPAQRRITRRGRQYAWATGDWQPVLTDIISGLAAAGYSVAHAVPGNVLPLGISVWDAETDSDLDAIARAGLGVDDVLWVGSGGLAAALARVSGVARESDSRALTKPVLGLVGSEHATTREQLARLGKRHVVLGVDGDEGVARRLTDDRTAFVSVLLPVGTSRSVAARLIDERLSMLLQTLDPPGTLFVTGGETLRGVCGALGAEQLDVVGEIMPGVPRSIIRGGRWDGVTVVSKSGAFGAPDLLEQLTATHVAAIAGAAA